MGNRWYYNSSSFLNNFLKSINLIHFILIFSFFFTYFEGFPIYGSFGKYGEMKQCTNNLDQIKHKNCLDSCGGRLEWDSQIDNYQYRCKLFIFISYFSHTIFLISILDYLTSEVYKCFLSSILSSTSFSFLNSYESIEKSCLNLPRYCLRGCCPIGISCSSDNKVSIPTCNSPAIPSDSILTSTYKKPQLVIERSCSVEDHVKDSNLNRKLSIENLENTSLPTLNPTNQPTFSLSPTQSPTESPTQSPTEFPTINPTQIPTLLPSSPVPTLQPSIHPTLLPSTSLPTNVPSLLPTLQPTLLPSNLPTLLPTINDTSIPTSLPTNIPTSLPSNLPTNIPSSLPTNLPSNIPSSLPTSLPSSLPSSIPTNNPTSTPTNNPTTLPTEIPTFNPTLTPTSFPTSLPTSYPSIIYSLDCISGGCNSNIGTIVMYILPVIFAGLFVIGLFIKYLNQSKKLPNSTTQPPSSTSNTKKKFSFPGGKTGYVDMDDEEDQAHAVNNLDSLKLNFLSSNGNDSKKNSTVDDPFNFGRLGESKTYTPLFSPDKKRNSIVRNEEIRKSPQNSNSSLTQAPSMSTRKPSSEFEFADFTDFVTVGFDT